MPRPCYRRRTAFRPLRCSPSARWSKLAQRWRRVCARAHHPTSLTSADSCWQSLLAWPATRQIQTPTGSTNRPARPSKCWAWRGCRSPSSAHELRVTGPKVVVKKDRGIKVALVPRAVDDVDANILVRAKHTLRRAVGCGVHQVTTVLTGVDDLNLLQASTTLPAKHLVACQNHSGRCVLGIFRRKNRCDDQGLGAPGRPAITEVLTTEDFTRSNGHEDVLLWPPSRE